MSTSNVLPFAITAPRSRSSIAGVQAALRVWKSRSLASCDCFSASLERASSMLSGAASALGLRKVLTPMIGSEPSCFLCS